MNDPISLGELIRQRRQALGLTQEQLAEKISAVGEYVRQTDISRLERNQIRLPRHGRLQRIATALDIPLGELLAQSGWIGAEEGFPESENPAALSDETRVVCDSSDRMSPEDLPQRWEEFQTSRRLRYIRPTVIHKWQDNCSDSTGSNVVSLSDVDLLERERVSADLIDAAGPFLEHMSITLDGKPHVIVLADGDGWILDLVGTPQEFGGREAGLNVGASLAEKHVGANGIGTALAARRPVLMYGVERYFGSDQPTACLGLPVHQGGSIVGALGILVRQHDADPARLDLAQACARSIETVLMASDERE